MSYYSLLFSWAGRKTVMMKGVRYISPEALSIVAHPLCEFNDLLRYYQSEVSQAES